MGATFTLSQFRSGIAYLALFFGASVFLPGSTAITVILACTAIFLGWGLLRPVARTIAALILIVTVLALVFDPTVLGSAMQSMAGIVGLILSVMVLSGVLGTSKDLDVISRSLFKGQSSSRYMGLSFGTGILAIPLNFGSVGLVASMIGARVQLSGDDAASRNAARAVIRGFGASPMGSPLSVAVVMTVTLLPGLASWSLLAWSIPFAVTYLMIGVWFREKETSGEDGIEMIEPDSEEAAEALGSWARFIGLALLVSLEAFALNTWAGLRYSQAVTISCLTVAALCLLVRRFSTGSARLPTLSNVVNELAIMGGASFLGGALAVTALNSLGDDFALSDWAYSLAAFCIPWVFYLGGMVAVNPIVTATVIGGVMGPIWPEASVVALGLGMVTGWGITIAGTPFSANALLLERFTGYRARRAAYAWNLKYSFLFLGLSGGLCAVLILAAPILGQTS